MSVSPNRSGSRASQSHSAWTHPLVLMYMPLVVIKAIHARWTRPQKVWPVTPCIHLECRHHACTGDRLKIHRTIHDCSE